MAASIHQGTIDKLKSIGSLEEAVVLQVTELQENNGKLKCQFSDGGRENISGLITSQVARQFGSELKSNDLVKIMEGNINQINDKQVLIVASMELIPSDTANQAQDVTEPPAAVPTDAPIIPKIEEDTTNIDTTGTAKTPMPTTKTTAITTKTPASGPSPPSAGATGPFTTTTTTKPRAIQPINTLNPYIHGWAIRCKVLTKTSIRTFKSGSGSCFSAELVDDQGTAIDATFWRDAVSRFYDALDVGKVYTFSKGSVKPSNKQYAMTRHEYSLHFDASTDIQPCEGEDIDALANGMTAKMNFVSIDQLAAFVDKKTAIDLLGVVTAASALSSVKRKSDSSEVARRDVTLVDQGSKTVVVTLWGNLAETVGEQLHSLVSNASNPIVAISSCRVSSYNGVSVSTLTRSHVMVNPSEESVPESKALQEWFKEHGRDNEMTAVGEGLATMKSKQGVSKPRERLTLHALRAEAPTTPETKPTYHTVTAMVADINPEQSLYYLACPENNRKVVEQGGQYYCEYDGRLYPSATRRYIMQAKAMDTTGVLPIQIFNDQAEVLLGKNADDLHAVREKAETEFSAVLKDAAWTEWVLRIKAQAQEYNGETRQRYAVADMQPLNFVTESRRTLDLIQGGGIVSSS